MQHITRTKTARNSDGSFKSIGDLLKSQVTIAQYGRILAQLQKGSN